MTEIRTDRLLLRRWRDTDRDPFAALNADPVVMRHLLGPITRDRSDAFFDRIGAQWDHSGWGLWAVEVPAVAAFIGYIGLWPADDVIGRPAVEVGWRLARRHWGNGYATEGAGRALAYGFVTLGLDEIVSFTVPQNERSRRVMERIGLVHAQADDFDDPRIDRQANPDMVRHVLYRLSRETWRASVSAREDGPADDEADR